MGQMFRVYFWVAAVALVEVTSGEVLNAREWRYSSPVLTSQVRLIGHQESDSLLSKVCAAPVRGVTGGEQTCTTRRLGPDFSGIVDNTFHPKGVIFGHFLNAESEDAAISGSSAEGHPARWGGTLLLSKRGGSWIPIWYRSGLVTESCEKLRLLGRREVLVCEDEDSGMGHTLHYLYFVDFDRPTSLQKSLLAKADSFTDDCMSQKQLLKDFQWSPAREAFSVGIETSEWARVSTEPYCANYPKRRPLSVRWTFEITAAGLHKVEGEFSPKE